MVRTMAWGLLTAALLGGAALAQDAIMGDYEGLWSLDKAEKPVIAQVIAEGDGNYRAVFKEGFNKRVDTIIEMTGKLEAGTATLQGSADKGPAAGTKWNGTTDGETFRGKIEGAKTGEFAIKKVIRLSPTLGLKPPSEAIVLFDGTNLDNWTNKNWKLIEGGSMEAKGGNNVTKQAFKDHRIHLEFMTPYMPKARGQGRGNSGVYLQNRYEIQVLDSYGLSGEANECGGIYPYAKPLVNACAPPLQWQTYDIYFRAPRFDAAGKLLEGPRATVLHNGVMIHNNENVRGDAKDPGPIQLQDHGNPVQYRNIWVVGIE